MDKHLIWGITLIVITSLICGTLIYLNENPYVFEVGENVVKVVESINYTAIENSQTKGLYDDCDFDGCNYICKDLETGVSISTLRYCYNSSHNYKQLGKEK